MRGTKAKKIRKEVYGEGYAKNVYELEWRKGSMQANESRQRYQKAK